jgi:hypothetical protein
MRCSRWSNREAVCTPRALMACRLASTLNVFDDDGTGEEQGAVS